MIETYLLRGLDAGRIEAAVLARMPPEPGLRCRVVWSYRKT